jgi:hypothetical protein
METRHLEHSDLQSAVSCQILAFRWRWPINKHSIFIVLAAPLCSAYPSVINNNRNTLLSRLHAFRWISERGVTGRLHVLDYFDQIGLGISQAGERHRDILKMNSLALC